MHLAPSLLGWFLLGVPAGPVQQHEEHEASFEHALDHRSIADLAKWREAHPWSLGDRLAGFLDGLLTTRKEGDRLANEHVSLAAAFLVEGLAEDPFSGWVMQVRAWDPEACSRHETVLEALASLPATIAAGEGSAAWTQIADLRDHLAPDGGWNLCAPALARCAAAYLHAGDREHARQLASTIAKTAEELRLGSVLAVCERILGEIERESGRLAACESRTARSFEIAGQLDSGKRGDLLAEIENLEAGEIDTLLEIAIEEKQTLVLATGNQSRIVRLLPIGRDWIAERTKRLRDTASFDEAAARELYERLIRPVERWLGPRLGVVTDGVPLELLVMGRSPEADAPSPYFFARDRVIVHLSRAPLGGWVASPGAEATPPAGTLVIVSDTPGSEVVEALEKQTSGPLSPVRILRAGAAREWAEEAGRAKVIHFEGTTFQDPLERLRADLVVLSRCAPGGFGALAERFHDAGVRDVVGPLTPAPDAILVRFYAELSRGEAPASALRTVRAEPLDGAWVIHRRY